MGHADGRDPVRSGADRPADERGRAARRPVSPGQRWTGLALVLLAWLAFVFPVFTGQVRFPVDLASPPPGQPAGRVLNAELGDAFYAFYPWHSYLGARLRGGEVPLWDPYRFAGTPFAADITTGVWYPPNWLYASGHILFAFTAIAVASILGALLLSYWFFRLVELHPYAAAFGAIAFVFSAFMMKWSTNEAVFGSSMWLPLALGGLEVARRGRVRRGVVLSAGGLALSVLAGHAQMTLIVWLAVAIWAAFGLVSDLRTRSASGRSLPRGLLQAAGPALAAFALAGGVGAVQLLPTAEFAGQIVRQTTSFSEARQTGLPVGHLPTLVIPDYQGSPLDGNYDGPGVNYTETSFYPGLLTLPLAAVGLLRRPRRVAGFFLFVTVVGVLAMTATPFYRLILALPGFSRTLFVTRFILLTDFGLAGLAAVGMHRLLVEPRRRTATVLVGSGAALLAGLAVLMLTTPGTTQAASYVTARGLRAAGIVVVGTVVLAAAARFPSRASPLAVAAVAVGLCDLWLFGFHFNPFHSPRPVYRRSAGIEYLAGVPGQRPRFANIGEWMVPPNGELQYRLPGISGYDPFVPVRIAELVGLAEDQRRPGEQNFLGPFGPETVSSTIFDLLGVATVVGSPDTALEAKLGFDGDFRAYQRATAFPPAWIAPCWEHLPESAVLPRMATMTSLELNRTAVVDDSVAARKALRRNTPPETCGTGGGAAAGRADLVRHDPERVVVVAEAEQAGVLVLSDAWFPGWRVKLDGRPAPLLRVDHALRGVALPPGRHTVEFGYRPASVVVGGGLSAATLTAVALWAAFPWRRRSAVDGQELDA